MHTPGFKSPNFAYRSCIYAPERRSLKPRHRPANMSHANDIFTCHSKNIFVLPLQKQIQCKGSVPIFFRSRGTPGTPQRRLDAGLPWRVRSRSPWRGQTGPNVHATGEQISHHASPLCVSTIIFLIRAAGIVGRPDCRAHVWGSGISAHRNKHTTSTNPLRSHRSLCACACCASCPEICQVSFRICHRVHCDPVPSAFTIALFVMCALRVFVTARTLRSPWMARLSMIAAARIFSSDAVVADAAFSFHFVICQGGCAALAHLWPLGLAEGLTETEHHVHD